MANLMIGNGINRLGNYSHSWEQVLQQLSETMGETVNMDGKSYLHIYEEVYSKAANKGKNEDILRSQIIEQLRNFKQNDYHKQILDLPFENIFTTNYDYGFTPNPRPRQKGDETIYSLKRFHEVDGKKVWYIHGELNAQASIMLGYDHYMKSIGKIQGHLIKKNNELNQVSESWVDAFLNDDLYILGLGLNFDEIDLWWLLVYRNRKISEKELEPTRFVYIDMIEDDKTKNSINTPYNPKHSMLNAYKVSVEPYLIGSTYRSYEDAYDTMMDFIKQKALADEI